MRKCKPVEFEFDPEIGRTTRRLRREHKNSTTIVAMDDLEDVENLIHLGDI